MVRRTRRASSSGFVDGDYDREECPVDGGGTTHQFLLRYANTERLNYIAACADCGKKFTIPPCRECGVPLVYPNIHECKLGHCARCTRTMGILLFVEALPSQHNWPEVTVELRCARHRRKRQEMIVPLLRMTNDAACWLSTKERGGTWHIVDRPLVASGASAACGGVVRGDSRFSLGMHLPPSGRCQKCLNRYA
jgi:hypothetical protein